MRHAKDELALLGGIGDTVANLREAIAGEHHETTEMYPTFAKEAEQEADRNLLFARGSKWGQKW